MRVALAVFAVFSFLAVCVPGAGRADEGGDVRFFEALGDVPLMPGLAEAPDESIVFDQPGGRIAESAGVSSSLELSDITGFYGRVLPQMGWVPVAEGVFARGGESLTMRVESKDGLRVVRFSVSPR